MGTPPSAEGSLITSINGLTRKMEKLGGKLITAGGEGTIQVMPNEQPPSSFFKGRYLGLEAVSEWLARKEKA